MSRLDPTPAFARATLHIATLPPGHRAVPKLRAVTNTALIEAPGFAKVLDDFLVAIAP
jgi:hypothetical protein